MTDEVFINIAHLFADKFDRIVLALEERNAIERERLDKMFPPKREPRDATTVSLKTDEDRLKEEQGQSDESDDEWIGKPGPIESKFLREKGGAAEKQGAPGDKKSKK